MNPYLQSFLLLAVLAAWLSGAGCLTSSLQENPTTSVSPVQSGHTNTTAFPAEYPDITGIWKADDGDGYYLNTTIQRVGIGVNTWVFTSQHGHIVEGYKSFPQPDGTTAHQSLAGMFDPDGKSIYFIDQPGGWAKGTIIDPNTIFITLTYSSGRDTMGNTMALTMTLRRQGG